MKDFNAEGAAARRVPIAPVWFGEPHRVHDLGTPSGAEDRVAPDAGDHSASETRECENCGQQKPIEEMSTVFLPGTGESYQCEQCRGLPVSPAAWVREQMAIRKDVGDEWRWWHWIPYAWVFTRDWWSYILGPRRPSFDCGVIRTAICRWRGHPAGVWFFNPGGYEPDMHCKECGDDLG